MHPGASHRQQHANQHKQPVERSVKTEARKQTERHGDRARQDCSDRVFNVVSIGIPRMPRIPNVNRNERAENKSGEGKHDVDEESARKRWGSRFVRGIRLSCLVRGGFALHVFKYDERWR